MSAIQQGAAGLSYGKSCLPVVGLSWLLFLIVSLLLENFFIRFDEV